MNSMQEIDWIPSPNETDIPILVSVPLIEEKWRLDVSYYIGPGGSGKPIEDRYQRIDVWLSENNQIWMPAMCLDENLNPSFTDGRHRFAWCRDHGINELKIVVPADEVEIFSRLYGAQSHTLK